MESLEAGFERDLRAWMARVYERRARLNGRRLEQRILQVLESERRWLVPLTIGVLIGASASPVVGAPALLGSLVLLYVGALYSGYHTMRRTERMEQSLRGGIEAGVATEGAWQARPALGADERARLIRLMNLSRSAAAPSVRPALLAELSEALSQESLAGWPFLWELQDLLQADPAALAREPAPRRALRAGA